MADQAQPLPTSAQAAAVRQMMHDEHLTLDTIASRYPHLADGVTAVRSGWQAPRLVGSGSLPLQRTPIGQL